MITLQFPSGFPFETAKEQLIVDFQDKLILDFSNVTNITKKEAYLIIGVLWGNLGKDFNKWIFLTGINAKAAQDFCEACTMYSYSNICIDKINSVINEPSTSCLTCNLLYTSIQTPNLQEEKVPTIFFSR